MKKLLFLSIFGLFSSMLPTMQAAGGNVAINIPLADAQNYIQALHLGQQEAQRGFTERTLRNMAGLPGKLVDGTASYTGWGLGKLWGATAWTGGKLWGAVEWTGTKINTHKKAIAITTMLLGILIAACEGLHTYGCMPEEYEKHRTVIITWITNIPNMVDAQTIQAYQTSIYQLLGQARTLLYQASTHVTDRQTFEQDVISLWQFINDHINAHTNSKTMIGANAALHYYQEEINNSLHTHTTAMQAMCENIKNLAVVCGNGAKQAIINTCAQYGVEIPTSTCDAVAGFVSNSR